MAKIKKRVIVPVIVEIEASTPELFNDIIEELSDCKSPPIGVFGGGYQYACTGVYHAKAWMRQHKIAKALVRRSKPK